MTMFCYYVYMLTNKNNTVIYVGMTNNLERRVYEHKTKQISGFTSKYNIDKLVYFEQTHDVHSAIAREKEIKKWRREKKNILVLSMNPEWKDLSIGWFENLPTVEMTRRETVVTSISNLRRNLVFKDEISLCVRDDEKGEC